MLMVSRHHSQNQPKSRNWKVAKDAALVGVGAGTENLVGDLGVEAVAVMIEAETENLFDQLDETAVIGIRFVHAAIVGIEMIVAEDVTAGTEIAGLATTEILAVNVLHHAHARIEEEVIVLDQEVVIVGLRESMIFTRALESVGRNRKLQRSKASKTERQKPRHGKRLESRPKQLARLYIMLIGNENETNQRQ